MSATREALHAGMTQAALCFDAEQERDDTFGERAMRYLRWYVTCQTGPFSAEAVSIGASIAGIEPKDGRAWGQIFRAAQREGLIRRSNTMIRRALGHGSYGPAWERAL